MVNVMYANVRPFGGPPTTLLVGADGCIVATGLAPELYPGVRVVDGGGALALPSLVDAHLHPDGTRWSEPWLSRKSGTSLEEFIANDVEVHLSATRTVAERAVALMAHAVSRGTRAWRAHVDVAPPYGTGNVEGVLEAAEQFRGVLDVQIVAFPQLGILREPGTAELLERSIRMGADLVGGLDPVGIDNDLDGHLDVIFGIAERAGVGLDIHLHERGDVGLHEVEEIARRTIRSGLGGRVTVGHAFCLANADRERLLRVADLLREADIGVTTCGLGHYPVVPFRELLAEGVRVALGTDAVRDAWTPFGDADMLRRVHYLAYVTGAITDGELEDCFDLASRQGARLLGLPPANFAVGDPADFFLVPGESLAQVVVDCPLPTHVVRGGNLVSGGA
jgi:cytosine/creatinine deaminase